MEAMLAGCIPVGSKVAGIPTIIDKYGYIIDQRDPQGLEKALDLALQSEADRKEISESIKNRFNLQIRKEKLLNLLNKYN
jgi:glycosyltransferase involved in cell wall biosynthesis